jgi:simple sugar transport system permease protein
LERGAAAPQTASPQLSVANRTSLVKKLRSLPLLWPLAALLVLLIVNVIRQPSFFHIGFVDRGTDALHDWRLSGSLIDILNRGTPVMLMALGMAMVIGTGGIDLSVGAVMALAGSLAACMLMPEQTAFDPMHPKGVFVAMTLGILISIAAGLWNGLLVAFFRVQPIVATLVLMVAGRGIAQVLRGNAQPAIDQTLWPGFASLGRSAFLWLPFPITVVAVVALLTLLFTRWTALGLFIESIGNNPIASRYAGVPERTVKLVVYAFSGLCAGLAGLIQTSDVMSADPGKIGLYRELDAILAVAVGGTALTGGRFSLLGALLGALIMQSLETTILTSSIPPEATMVVKAAVVLMICLLQSERFRALWIRGYRRLTFATPGVA